MVYNYLSGLSLVRKKFLNFHNFFLSLFHSSPAPIPYPILIFREICSGLLSVACAVVARSHEVQTQVRGIWRQPVAKNVPVTLFAVEKTPKN